MATSIYDPTLWDNLPPANVTGGRHRALKARRDLLGRFLPDDPIKALSVELDPDHGKAGGLAILQKRGRDYFKALAKKRWEKQNENLR